MEILPLDKEFLPVGTTVVHIAVNSGQIQGLLSLLDRDCSLINCPDQYGHSPLAAALRSGRLEAAQVLIQYGAKLDVQYGKDAQHTLAQVLITTPAFYPLARFAFESNTAFHCDVSSVLPALAYEGDVDMLERILRTEKVKVDYRDYLRCTALHYASQRGFSEAVRVLLRYGAVTTVTNSCGSTALHLACSAGHLDIAMAILEVDTTPEKTERLLNTRNTARYTPVTCALNNKHLEVAQYILTKHLECIDISQIGSDGHMLSGFSFYLRYFKQPSLIKPPFRFSLPCLSSEEALWLLHESVYVNDTAALRSALTQGASIECLDYMQQTPLILAAKLGSVQMCRSLTDCGADPSIADVAGKTPLVHAIEHGRHRVVAYFLSQFPLSESDCHSLTSPLCSSAMLAVLVSYFEDNNHKPNNWLAWLALVVPTAPKKLFLALVNAIAPHDWIQQMLANCSASTYNNIGSPSPVVNRVAKYPTLPAYVQEEIVGKPLKPKPKLVRSFSQPRKWFFTRPPPSTLTQWTFKHLPRPKKAPTTWKMEGKPFSMHVTRAKQNPVSVIHKAALHNIDIFRYILSNCEETELQEKILLSRDGTGRTALELVLPHFDTVSEAVTSLELTEVAALDKYLREKFTLPESLLFEEALVHYLCVGQHVLSSQHSCKLQSPLQAWPLWYLQQQVNAFCANYESGFLLLAVFEDRKELLHLLLDHKFLSSDWGEEVKAYPPPLFAAIQYDCAWAVEPLLFHGADPATHYNGRFAIEEAAKHGQLQTLDLLLQSGFTSFLALADNTPLLSSLLSALGPLTSAGHIKCAVKLIEGLDLSRYLWSSRFAPHLLFVAQALNDGSEAYETLVQDFIAFLCLVMLHWESESPQVCTAVLHTLVQLRHRCFVHNVNVCESTKNLLLFIETAHYAHPRSQKTSFGELFHFLCGSGNHDVISFLCKNGTEGLINKSDTQGLTPLVHAACSGHLKIVKLLLKHGAVLKCSPGMSPIVGALLYLALAPYNVGGDTLGKSYNFMHRQRKRCLEHYRCLLPKHSFSLLCDDLAGAKELVRLLLPPQLESIYTHLSTFPAHYRPFHTSLILIASVRVSSVLEPLLNRIAQEAMPSSFYDSLNKSFNSGDSRNGNDRSVLGTALELAPPYTGSESSQLFETFLLHFVPDGELLLTDVFAAARKGYWDVIDSVVSTSKIISSTHVHAAGNKREIALLRTYFLAIKAGKRDLVCVLLQVGQSAQLFKTQWWPRLVSTAVRTGHADIVCDLIAGGCSVLLCLRAAARWGSVNTIDLLFESLTAEEVAKHFAEMLTVAAQCNQQPVIQLLFNLYQNRREIEIDAELLSRNVSFWLWVLVHATRNGHQHLALQAVGCVSEQEMNTVVSRHRLYHDILYYSCYWGFSELLACLPHIEGALLARQVHESPLEAAIANGRLGCIPNHSQFPLLDDLDSWFEDSPLQCMAAWKSFFVTLQTGLFHQLCTLESTTSESYLFPYSNLTFHPLVLFCMLNEFVPTRMSESVLCMPNGFLAFEKLSGNFCAPILVYALKKWHFDLLDIAASMASTSLLEQVLQTLFSSDYFSFYCSHLNMSLLSRTMISGHTTCLELLLRSGEIFVKQLSVVNTAGQNILHIAVMSKRHNVDTLTVVLDWLADSACDMCFALDHKGMSPISLAFHLGEYEKAAKLLEKAQFSTRWLQVQNAELDWRTEAKKARGWDRVMMQHGREVTKVERDFQFNIRSGRVKKTSAGMLRKAVLNSNRELVNALLVASCGLLLEDEHVLTVGLLDPSVLNFLSACPSYLSIRKLDATVIICKTLEKRDCSKEVQLLLNLAEQKRMPISINQNKVFLAACTSSRSALVHYFLKNATSIPTKVLQSGSIDALNHGAWEIAAAALLSDRSNCGLAVDLIPWSTPIVQLIFGVSREYQTIVEDFFGSLARHEATGRLPFPETWLVHQWGPYQIQLLEKMMGNSPGTPSNPWTLGVLWQEHPHTVAITVDWESFADCLQDPTYPQSLPMLVEAVVFSSSVLGQLCLTEDRDNSTYNMADFFDCPLPPKSVAVSAVRWPYTPSAYLASSDKGQLTLSYKSEERVFVFPPVERTDRGWDESYSTDSGMHSFCFTDTSINTKQDESTTSLFSDGFTDLGKYYQRRIKRTHQTSTNITIDGLLGPGMTDHITSSVVLSALQTVFDSCSEVLHLSSLPTTAYADLSNSTNVGCLPAPPRKKLFSHIGINISAAEEGETSSAVVSLVDSALDFSIALAIDSSVCPPYAVLPSFESLLQQTVHCTLSREVQVLQERLMRTVSASVIPQLQQCLRTTIDADCVEVLFEDVSGATTDLSLTTISHLQTLKALPSIRKFLHNFCDIVRAYSHKPKLIGIIRSCFQRRFRLVVSEVNSTDITIGPSAAQLTIQTCDLSYPPRQNALLSLTTSLFKQAQPGRGENLKNDLKDIPCPFLTHVDLSSSKTFLYPRVGSVAKLTIQVVSYEQKKLSLPLKYNCYLEVAIRSPTANTLKASSSEEPSSSTASTNLLVNTSLNGQFEVCWTPVEEGLHSVSLTLNGVAIQETFKRVFVEKELTCSGKRQVSAGSHTVFIATHVGCKCPHTSRNSSVVLTRETVIAPSPFLKDLPGFSTFLSPFNRSGVLVPFPVSPAIRSRSPDELKEAVSAMTGLSPVNYGCLEPPLPLLHHISVTAAYGGSWSWSHISSASVTVHVSAQEETRTRDKKSRKKLNMSRAGCLSNSPCTSVSLGNGMYRVSLQWYHAGSYKVFASCPVCQSVMRIHWLNEQSFYPQLYYVLPGPFSSRESTIFDMANGRSPTRCQYKPGSHGFYLNCYDEFGNAHTVGGKVKKAVVKRAGRLTVGPELSLEAIQQASPLRQDCECEVRHVGSGRYSLKCTLQGAGTHPLLVTDAHGKTECMTTLRVTHARIWPPHCWLDPNNVYRTLPDVQYTCHVYLYDRYFNPCCGCESDLRVSVFLGEQLQSAIFHTLSSREFNRLMIEFTPRTTEASCELKIAINNQIIGDLSKTFCIRDEVSFMDKLRRVRNALYFREQVQQSFVPIITMDRSNILESALQNHSLLKSKFRVRFRGENGIDGGGISREFFHLLSQELVNPQYALFQNTNGLHRPSPYSSVNPSHFQYFSLCGEVLARMICDNYQTVVHFTPAVYKFLLGQECTMDDLKIEDPTLHKGLMAIACCDSDESLDHLAMNFTTSQTHFGSLETVELERGGQERRVTLSNRDEFVRKFCRWHLNGCIHSQLVSMREGFNLIIPHTVICCFYWHELEMILCGQQAIDISLVKSHTWYNGYASQSPVVVWLWQVLESFSQEEWCQFLQFTTGSARLPFADTGQWRMEIKKGSPDESLLPTAATCFNALTLPCYTRKATLQQKLMQAISYGQLAFLTP